MLEKQIETKVCDYAKDWAAEKAELDAYCLQQRIQHNWFALEQYWCSSSNEWVFLIFKGADVVFKCQGKNRALLRTQRSVAFHDLRQERKGEQNAGKTD